MKTSHLCMDSCYFSSEMKDALTSLQSEYIRAVPCGRGVVFLPDTDRSKDCKEKELCKALGIKKSGDNIQIGQPKEQTHEMMFSFNEEPFCTVTLNDSQIRLMEFLDNQEVLHPDFSYNSFKNIQHLTV